ncbi:cell wall-binding repeat-containing protein [Agromyces sp. M3QZ16-3]|uniref:cell wall-binding repeat-containing protein n=1 Tax=Agromyces sp. M3QZ16-3 TaxID=3447585 RepID=UPI003F6928DD
MRPRRPRLPTALAAALAIVLAQPVLAPAHAGEPELGLVQGTVAGPDGQPLPEGQYATVSVKTASFANTGGLAVGSTRSDGAGAFSFQLPPGEYHLSFTHYGSDDLLNEWWGGSHRRSGSELVVVEPGGTVTTDVRFDRGVDLHGTITGVDGPVGAAYIYMDDYIECCNNALNIPHVTVSPDGTWRALSVAPGEYGMRFSAGPKWRSENHNGLAAGDPGYPGQLLLLREGDSVALDIVLERTTAIEGIARVHAPEGERPFQGDVTIWKVGNPYQAAGFDRVREEDRGAWEFHAVEPGEYTIGFAPTLLDRWTIGGRWTPEGVGPTGAVITVADGEVLSGIDALLQTGGRVGGRVLVEEPGVGPAPTAGQVTLLRLDADSGAYLPVREWPYSTADDGTFDVGPVPPGEYAVHFTVDRDEIGDEYWQDARYFAARTDIVIQEGIRAELGDVTLEPRYFDVGRLGGADRFATAVEISKAAIEDGGRAPVVYVANAYNFPDALAAGPAAIHKGGVVLTVPADRIPAVVAAELRRIRPERIVVAGGTGSVSDVVFRQLASYVDEPDDLVRLGGPTRYETARMIVRDAFGASGAASAFLATGGNFPDALAAGPAAGALGGPVLLVDGSATSVDAQTAALVDDLGVDELFIAGGTGSISPGIEASFAKLIGGEDRVVRLAGPDRYSTAAAVNGTVFANAEFALIASGSGFPDALAGGPLAGLLGAPIHLSPGACIPSSAAAGIVESGVLGVILLGGPGALGATVEALEVCG